MKNLVKNEFIQGGIILTAANFLIGFLNYLFNILVGRALGPKGYGEIATLIAYIFLTTTPIAIFSTLVVQKISSRTENKYSFALSLEKFLITKAKRWWFILIIFLLIFPFLPSLTNLMPLAAYSLIPLIILAFVSAFYNSALQALKLFIAFTAIGIISTLLKLFSGLLVFFGKGGISLIIIFLIFSTFLVFYLSYIVFHKMVKLQKNKQIVVFNKRLIHFIFHPQVILYSAATIAFTTFNNVDIVLAKKMFSGIDAGIYSSWSLFAKMVYYALSPLLTISFIFFSSPKGIKKQHRALLIVAGLLLIGGLTAFIVYELFGKSLVLALFGDRYQAIIPYLGKASIFGFVYVLTLFINGYFLAKKSSWGMIMFFSLPFYIGGLILVQKQISSYINFILVFSTFLLLAYIFSLFILLRFNSKPSRY